MHFFVAGYPKCGTTSLYDYLKDHPDIFLPELKEPHFYTTDYPGARAVTTETGYRELYANAAPGQLCGDASASVIHSGVALDRILARNPSSKFIVLLRDPVAAVRSFHGELLHNLTEDVPDFERAWALQAARAEGHEIPATCGEPRFLQYSEIFRYREHLPVFFDKVPAEQRLLLVFETFFADPAAGYRQILDFLGLTDDGRHEFGTANSARRHRFRRLAEIHRRIVTSNGPVYRRAKGMLSRLGIHPSHILARFNRKPCGKLEISDAFKAELRAYFKPDVDAAERLLGLPIEHWRR